VAYTEGTLIDLASRLVLDRRARFRRFEEEGIIINQRTAEALVVSEVATRLLELTDGSRTLQDCAATLSDEFDAPAPVIGSDIVRFAQELADAGIVSVA
jgi:hypothetical protein